MKKKVFFIGIIIIIIFCIISCSNKNEKIISTNNTYSNSLCAVNLGENEIKFNNNIEHSDLITVTHSHTEFNRLIQTMQNRDVSLEEFYESFNVECVRKTFQGYYIVLLLDNDCIGFAFFNEYKTLTDIFTTSSFMESNDFDFIIKNVTTEKEVDDFNNNSFSSGVSSMSISCHIVKDGLLVIKCDNEEKYGTVRAIEFYSNDNLEKLPPKFVVFSTPYILPIDKI